MQRTSWTPDSPWTAPHHAATDTGPEVIGFYAHNRQMGFCVGRDGELNLQPTSSRSSRKLQARMSWIFIFPVTQLHTELNSLTYPFYSFELTHTLNMTIHYVGFIILNNHNIPSDLYAGGPGRRRTCALPCRRRRSRRTSPVRPAEAEWGSALGCSSLGPRERQQVRLWPLH